LYLFFHNFLISYYIQAFLIKDKIATSEAKLQFVEDSVRKVVRILRGIPSHTQNHQTAVLNEPSVVNILPPIDISFIQHCTQYIQENMHILKEFNQECDAVVSHINDIWHSKEHLKDSIKDYLKHEIQSCLDCVVLDVDSSYPSGVADCDVIKLYIVIGKSYAYSWCNILIEHFTNLVESGLAKLSSSSRHAGKKISPKSKTDTSSITITHLEVLPVLNQLNRRNVDATVSPHILLIINQTVVVHIYDDPTLHLCFHGLIEEFSEIVGNNQLLKRCFLFCKTFIESQISFLQFPERIEKVQNDKDRTTSIDNDVVWLIVLMVFNKYPASSIENPIQFLAIMLVEMASYQPEKHFISIYGLMKDGQLSPKNKDTAHLPMSVLDKYIKLFNPVSLRSLASIPQNREAQNPRIAFIHPVDQNIKMSSHIISLRTTSNSPVDIFQFSLIHFAKLLREINEEFQIPHFPFTFDEKLQYVERLLGYFFENEILAYTEAGSSSSFRIGESNSSSVHSFHQLLSSIAYCHMINKGIISDSSLLFAVIQAIEMKGALPVGEVGKVMSIHGDAASLSKFIKDRFGGLKKYLERFPLLFVFGDDHEYNPHVFLISQLSDENKAKIDLQSNTLSMEYMVRHRQV
jgi:hypothetical protein